MKARISLHWALTFYTGMTLISCDEYYLKNEFNPTWQTDIFSSYGKTRITPTFYIKNEVGTNSSQQNINNAIPETVHKYEALPYDKYGVWLAFILNPDIFSQSNPLVHLVKKTTTLTKDIAELINSDVKEDLLGNHFPPHYVPYAKMLSSILDCRSDLQSLRRAISNIAYFSKTSPITFTIPAEFATSSMLPAMFSQDVFSDPKPPSVIFSKIMELPENAVPDLISQLGNISRYGRLNRLYAIYAIALGSFMQNNKEFKTLREYHSEMNNAP